MVLNSTQYKQMLDALSEAVYCVDNERIILYWNKAAEQLTGYSFEEIVGVNCEQGPLQHVDVANRPLCEDSCPLVQCIKTAECQEKLVFALHKDGRRIPVVVKTSAIYDDNGNIFGAVEMFTDASEILQIKEMNKELLRQIHLDVLTGVPNKQTFFDALDREWFRFKRYNTPFSILALEIDFFKQLLESFGKTTSDAVVRWLVERLRTSLRRADIMGHIEDDKFMVLLSFSSRKSTLKVAHMMLEMVRKENCLDLPMAMTISIGAATIEHGESMDSVLERVEKALARSKETGHNQVTFWG